LLRRDVTGRSEDGARLRDGNLLDVRDAEVEHAHVGGYAVHEEQVTRLDVAMDDAAPMSDPERVRHAAGQGQRFAEREGHARQTLREIFPLEPLHREVEPDVVRLPVRDVAHDPRVAKVGQDLGFSEEPLGVLAHLRVQNLQRDPLAGRSIVRTEDGSHAPAPRSLFDLEPLPHHPTRGHPLPVRRLGGGLESGHLHRRARNAMHHAPIHPCLETLEASIG
jgi:hypothetical protein